MANTRIIIYLFIIIIIFIKCDVYRNCESRGTPNDKNDCIDRISEDDKDDGYHCCFIAITSGGVTDRNCEILEKDEFNDIGGYKSEIKAGYTDSPDVDIQCYQSYMKLNKYMIFSLLNLLLLIIM